MKLGKVIGRVTLNKVIPQLEGARWLVVSPFTREFYQRGRDCPGGMSTDSSLIAFDHIGGRVGESIAYVEGREAAVPFEKPIPIDAYTCALVDDVCYEPAT
jgi:microcompartment protein CcmK/EutM